jgi:serine phosphatase RsbU (regulator of sigma subunit)
VETNIAIYGCAGGGKKEIIPYGSTIYFQYFRKLIAFCMQIRTFSILTLAGLLVVLDLQAQPNRYGVPIITNYPYIETGGSEQNWCITQDFRGVVYVGNNDKGVLEYDGVEWRNIPIPNNAAVSSMVTGQDGVVYVGARNEFGRLEPDATGKLHFFSLCDTTVRNRFPDYEVHKTYFVAGKVYFCSIPGIFVYDPGADTLGILETPEYAWFSFFVGETLYNGEWGSGLMKYDGEKFRTVPGGEFFREMTITGLERFDSDRLLISTYARGIYLLNTRTGELDDSFVDPELMEEFRAAQIPYMHFLNNNILVCTFYNGLYILDRSGEVKEIISQTEGLINNTISQVYTDERLKGSGPLWIAHWKGVSKVEANNPFRMFTEKSGFEGLITDIIQFNGRLFISTMGGLYYKSSTKSSTSFLPVPGIQAQIWDLHVLEPEPGKSLLLVSSDKEIFVIDQDMKMTTIGERMINPPENLLDEEQFSGRYILPDYDKPDVIYTGYSHVVGLQYIRGRWKEFFRFRDIDGEILKMAKDRYGYLWVSTAHGVIQLDVAVAQEATMKSFDSRNGLPADADNMVFSDPQTREVIIGTQDGFYRYNYFLESLVYDSIHSNVLPRGSNYVKAFYMDRDGDFWFSVENEFSGWTELIARKNQDHFEVISENPFYRLPNASVDVFFSDPENGVWFSKSDELYHFDKSFSRNDTLPFRTLIRKVVINKDSVLYYGSNFTSNGHGGYTIQLFQEEDTQPYIKYRYNNIEFHWAAPYFEQEEDLEYSYKLQGFSDEWSVWYSAPYKEFTNLKYGKYTMNVKTRNVYGYESEPARYSFVINRPWYASIPAILTYILLSGLLVYIIIKLYTRRLKQENIRLEGIIEERTAEIRKQKEELTDSIEYASRIQRALLPSDRLMEERNIEHFILFRPRDIVSGDFYWMGSKGDKLLIVAADCTGHGVPGAFMSMLGMTFLDEIVIKSGITSTEQIMEALRAHVINSLEQSGRNTQEAIKDGMDLAMISLDLTTNMIQYSGAYNPLYLVRKLKRSEKAKLGNGEELDVPRGSIHDEESLLLQMRADQMPIGVSEKDKPFSATTFKDEGFNLYMFSDGFLDQFGGPQGKKFMSKNFKKLLLELQSIPMKEQGAALEKVLLGWMGEISQIDDILVMGLRMNPQ